MLLVDPSSKLILASGSPRRRELLKEIGLKFEVISSDLPEEWRPDETPEAMVQRLAFEKARVVAEKYPEAWVIGADTDVYIDQQVLSKPQDSADAERMLTQLQGRRHTVWGGFAIINLARTISYSQALSTEVEMVEMDQDLIKRYVATGDPMDKAGGYAIQGLGGVLVSKVYGSYLNVVGLPLAELVLALRTLGFLR